MVTKENLADGKDLNTIVASDVAKALKTHKKSKVKAMDDSDLKNELGHLNFEKIRIGADSRLK